MLKSIPLKRIPEKSFVEIFFYPDWVIAIYSLSLYFHFYRMAMELIKIYQGNLVDARDLWEFLEVKTQFNKWIGRMLDYGFEEGKEFWTNLSKTSIQGGRPGKEYFLSIQTAKEICMLQRNEKGKEARKYFIQAEETLKQLNESKRFAAFNKLETSKQKFKETILSLGLSDQDYIQIDFSGRRVLFNGTPIEDEQLNRVLLVSRDLATEMSHYNTLKKGLASKKDITDETEKNHAEIRNTLMERGITPEELSPEEDIKRLKN